MDGDRDALELVDIDGFEDWFGVAVLRDANHGSTELFGGGDVLREATFQQQGQRPDHVIDELIEASL